MWFAKKKDYDRFWFKSIFQLAGFIAVCMVLFAAAVIVFISDNFFYQVRMHIFDNYINISKLIREESFFLQSISDSHADKKSIFERVLVNSQSELSPYLYNGEIFKIYPSSKEAKTFLSLNPVEVGRYVSPEWLEAAFRSIYLQTYVWRTISSHHLVVGMPVLSSVSHVDTNTHMAISWIIPDYHFSLYWFRLGVVFAILIFISSIIFLFIFVPYIRNVHEPDMAIVERGQDRFDAAWRRLRKAQVSLLHLEDD
ncbi:MULTISPECIES: hypothetical protein [Candidatus Ichthyocystis]|nr:MULTISPECIES: hypothetical protein [Ichthyocystis]